MLSRGYRWREGKVRKGACVPAGDRECPAHLTIADFGLWIAACR